MKPCTRYADEVMVEYLAARLPAEEAHQLLKHCKTCPNCDRTLHRVDQFLRTYWPQFRMAVSELIGERTR